MGESHCKPVVRLDSEDPDPVLKWIKIQRHGEYVGDILAAFELIKDEGGQVPFTPMMSDDNKYYTIPKTIAPKLEDFVIEVYFLIVNFDSQFSLFYHFDDFKRLCPCISNFLI